MGYNCSIDIIENGAPMLATSRAATAYHRKDEFRMASANFTPTPSGCAVYIIQAKSAVKIGIARNVVTRLKELQTGNHEKLKIAFEVRFKNVATAQAVETFLHYHFRSSRLQGEWFGVSPDEVKAELQLVLKLCQVLFADQSYVDDEPEPAEDEVIVAPVPVREYPKFSRPVDLANAIVELARRNQMISKWSIQNKFGLDDAHTKQILLQFVKFRVITPPTRNDGVYVFIAPHDFHFIEKEQ